MLNLVRFVIIFGQDKQFEKIRAFNLICKALYDEELSYSSPEEVYTDAAYVQSRIGLQFDEATESKEEIMIRYASAVKIHPTPQPLIVTPYINVFILS